MWASLLTSITETREDLRWQSIVWEEQAISPRLQDRHGLSFRRMHLVTVSPNRDLVFLTFVGHVDLDEAKRYRRKVEALTPELRPGFRLLSDLSSLEEMDYSCADEVRGVMDTLGKAGLSQVVRVIPDISKDIGLTIMSYFHYGRGVKIHTVDSMAEALKLIDS